MWLFYKLCCIESLILFPLTGHEYYVDTVKENKLYDLNPRDIPWSTQIIREQEFAKIISIKYEIKSSITLCCLKVQFIFLENYCTKWM